jgi:hypothetical protein
MKRSIRIGWLSLVSLVVLAAFARQAAWGQANRATLTGTVTDTTGAVVAGVDVTVTNTGTNVPAKTVTNQDGLYNVPNLFPGSYSLQFEKSGFESFVRTGVSLNSTQVAEIDARLKVGAASESVTVSGDAPILDMDTASVGTNMKADVVNQLPLSIYGGGRFVEDFAVAITPGYSLVSSPYGAVVNGGQWFVKDYTIDGTSGTSNIRGDSMDGGPSMEAVEEVQATTSGLDAQSSITGGGVMSFNLKSGTNTLHGSTFLYGHNELLDANTWTNDLQGDRKPKERAWDYGFSLGGPIHKDKTFFFGTFERFQSEDWRLNSGGATVPTAAFLQGNFGALLGPELWTDPTNNGAIVLCSSDCSKYTPLMVMNDAGQSIQAQQGMIYDPKTGDQFTNNTIPTGSMSAIAQKVNTYFSNYTPDLGGPDNDQNNERTLLSNTPSQTPNEFVVKLDHILRPQDHLSGSWIYDHKPRTLDDGGGVWENGTTNGGPLSNARIQKYTQQQFRISEAHTFGPNLLNVLNVTDAYDDNGSEPADPGGWNQAIGFGNSGANTFPVISFSDNGINTVNGTSETFVGGSWQGDVSGAVITIGDAVTWSKGRHNLSFGGDFVAHEVDSRSGVGAYSFKFAYNPTSCGSQWACAGAGYDGFSFATYELGLVNSATDSVANNLYGRQKDIAIYAQDSYKMTPKLTVNLGLRWSYNTRFHEKYGNWANFDPTVVNQQLAADYGAPIPGSLVFAKGGGDSFEKNEYVNNYGPSLGIAYQFMPNVVLHVSYGLIFNPVGVTFFAGVPDGFAPQLGSSQASNFNWDTASGHYPGVVSKATLATEPSTMYPFPVEMDPSALRLGYSEAFNFGVQQQITPNTRLEISYVGNRGHRLTDTALAWNEGSTSNFVNLVRNNPGLNAYSNYVCDPGTAATEGVPFPYPYFCAPALAAIAPLPQMASAEVNYWYYPNLLYAGLPLGQSFYDSMVVDVVKRQGRGLTMDMSFDWSRQEGDSYSAEQEDNGYYTGVQDFSNMREAAHAITGYDLPLVGKGYVSYQLPFGRGQNWLAGTSPVVNAIVGGWTVAGVVSYYTGQPFMVGASNVYYPLWGDIYPVFHPNNAHTSNPRKYVPLPPGTNNVCPNGFPQDCYMPTSVANDPAPGVLPPSPTSSQLRCPGQSNENSTFLKNNRLGPEGRYAFSFRIDFYNLFNRHYYNIQGCEGSHAATQSANFGEILGVQDNPRQGQFALRLDF